MITKSSCSGHDQATYIIIKLDHQSNHLLTISACGSKRNKRQEALIRPQESLENIDSIAFIENIKVTIEKK